MFSITRGRARALTGCDFENSEWGTITDFEFFTVMHYINVVVCAQLLYIVIHLSGNEPSSLHNNKTVDLRLLRLIDRPYTRRTRLYFFFFFFPLPSRINYRITRASYNYTMLYMNNIIMYVNPPRQACIGNRTLHYMAV